MREREREEGEGEGMRGLAERQVDGHIIGMKTECITGERE
jgi:hypothetical protein